MPPGEKRPEEGYWWDGWRNRVLDWYSRRNEGLTWFLGGLALFLLLSLLLGWGNAAGALTAAFTGLVALYTRRLAELQREVNRVMGEQAEVLERQAELMDRQRELMRKQAESAERQGEILAQQEALMEEQTRLLEKQAKSAERQEQILERQAKIQERLARAEVEPLVSLQLARGGHATLFISNLGKYGVEVEGVWVHSERPEFPLPEPGPPVRFSTAGVQGLPAPAQGTPVFPIGIGPGRTIGLGLSTGGGTNALQNAPFIEVRYRHGVDPDPLLSDLWEAQGAGSNQSRRLRRVWRAREVPEAGDQES